MKAPIKKVVFPVGGLGTRFLPATKSLPKEMLPIVNKPMIHHAFDEARDAGIEQFIFIIGRNKNAIIDHFDHAVEIESMLDARSNQKMLSATQDFMVDPGNIVFVRQQEPLGLGHAVWCARDIIGDEPFAVMLADDMFLKDDKIGIMSEMVSCFAEYNTGNLIAVAEVSSTDSKKYGMVRISERETIEDMVEKPDPLDSPSNFAIVGRYILQPSVFGFLRDTEASHNGEIQLTDALKKMLETTTTKAYKADALRLDCGNYLGYLEANIKMALSDVVLSNEVAMMLKNIQQNLDK